MYTFQCWKQRNRGETSNYARHITVDIWISQAQFFLFFVFIGEIDTTWWNSNNGTWEIYIEANNINNYVPCKIRVPAAASSIYKMLKNRVWVICDAHSNNLQFMMIMKMYMIVKNCASAYAHTHFILIKHESSIICTVDRF